MCKREKPTLSEKDKERFLEIERLNNIKRKNYAIKKIKEYKGDD